MVRKAKFTTRILKFPCENVHDSGPAAEQVAVESLYLFEQLQEQPGHDPGIAVCCTGHGQLGLDAPEAHHQRILQRFILSRNGIREQRLYYAKIADDVPDSSAILLDTMEVLSDVDGGA